MARPTNFAYGVASFGVPLLGGAPIPDVRGKVFFVNATGGSDNHDGRSVDRPLATIEKAHALATSGAGDVAYVFPGTYDEALTITKNYFTIIGAMLPGYARPDVAVAGIALTIGNANGVVLKHLRFVTTADTDTVVCEGNGCLFEDCVFDGDTANQTATRANLRFRGDATDDTYSAAENRVVDCLFRDSGGDALVFQHAESPNGLGCSDNQVLGCRFYGNDGDDIATANTGTTGGGASIGIVTNLLIHGCQFLTVDKAVYLDMDQVSSNGGAGTDNTGMISACYFADDAALDSTKIDISGTNLRFVGNYNAVGVVDGSSFDN